MLNSLLFKQRKLATTLISSIFIFLLKGNTLRKILLYRYFKGEYGSGMNGPLSASYSKTAQVGGKSTQVIQREQN